MKTQNLLIASLAAAALTGAATAALAAPNGQLFAGVWRPETPGPALKSIDGAPPPLTAAGKALFESTVADRKSGKEVDGVNLCLPPGTPRIMWQARPMMFLDTPRKVTLVYEFQHIQRHIHLTDPIPTLDDLNPNWGGTSVGRWEGDTLVVTTSGFNGETQLDGQGLPASTEMKLTERFRLIDNGQKLEDRITIEDPKNYSKPWTVRMTFARAPAGTVLKEHICSETLLKAKVRNYWAEHQEELKAQRAQASR